MTHYINTLWHYSVYNLMCRQVSLIWSFSISAVFPSIYKIQRFYFSFIQMCARDLSARVMDPAHLDSYFLEWAVRGFETKHGEKNIVVLALLCWLFMERIHPSLCALRAGAMRVGILGSEGSKRGNNSLQHVGGRWGPPVPRAFEIRRSRVHTHV